MFWDKSILIYLTALFILQYGCIEKQPENTNKSKNIQYAKGFTIYKKKDYKIIEVHNPWQKSGNITYRYILTDSAIDKKEIETEYNHIIRTPVQKVVCFSTTHISMIDNLNELESIKGITNADLIT